MGRPQRGDSRERQQSRGARGHHHVPAQPRDRRHRRVRGRPLQAVRQPARRRSFPTRKRPTPSSTSSTTPSGCTSSRWARSRCSPASRKSKFPSASRTPRPWCRSTSTASASPRANTSTSPASSSRAASASTASSRTRRSTAATSTSPRSRRSSAASRAPTRRPSRPTRSVVEVPRQQDRRPKAEKEFAKADAALQKLFVRFYYKQKVTEEFVAVCEHHHHELVEAEHQLERLHKSRSKSKEHNSHVKELERQAAGHRAAGAHAAGPLPRRPSPAHGLAAQGAQGQDRDGRGQPAPRHFHRQEVHQPRPLLPRPDPGRQHGPDEGGREIRVPPRLQVFHLRHVVDPPGHHPLHRRPGAHHPHPGAHDRDDQQAHARAEAARAGVRPRTHARGSGGGNLPAGRARPRRPAHGAAAHLAPGAGRRQRRHDLRRFHRGQVARRTRPR